MAFSGLHLNHPVSGVAVIVTTLLFEQIRSHWLQTLFVLAYRTTATIRALYYTRPAIVL